MRIPRALLGLVVLALLVAGLRRDSAADDESFVVVVNPDNTAASIDRELLRDAFLKKATTWGGETLRPVDLSARFSVRERFTRDVLKKTPAQLRSYWNQQIFSGKGVPPPEADSAAGVIQYVLEHKGGIGYVPAGTDTGGAKVIGVR